MSAPRRGKSVDQEAIEAIAAAWLAQRDEGLSTEETTEFAAWQRADPRHAAAVARLERAWSALAQLREFRPAARRHPDHDLLRRPAPRRAVSRIEAAGWAAIAAAAALMVAWLWQGNSRGPATPAVMPTYATSAGGYQRVTLEDGSLLELNANTSVRVQYTRDERRLWLDRGEAHFTVAKNKERPFRVHAGDLAVRAVGTEFNVRQGGGALEVLVTEGRVQVEAPTPAVLPEVPTLVAGDRAAIAAASAAPAAPRRLTIERLGPAAIRDALAWQEPRLVFADTPLGEAVNQFNRRNALQVRIGDDELATLPVAGSFRADNVEGFVRLLESGNEIRAERTEPNQIILRRAR